MNQSVIRGSKLVNQQHNQKNYKVEKVSDMKLKIEKVTPKAKLITNLTNVYAPTSEKAKTFPGEIQKMRNNQNKLCKEMDINIDHCNRREF